MTHFMACYCWMMLHRKRLQMPGKTGGAWDFMGAFGTIPRGATTSSGWYSLVRLQLVRTRREPPDAELGARFRIAELPWNRLKAQLGLTVRLATPG